MAKYTIQWWYDDLDSEQRMEVADAIEEAGITPRMFQDNIEAYEDALVPWLRKIHVYVSDFDYFVADNRVECDLDWDEDWYVDQAVSGMGEKALDASLDPSNYDLVISGAIDAWRDVESDVSDAMEDLRAVADSEGTDGRKFQSAKRKFLGTLQDCMVDLSDRIEDDAWGFIPYYYDEAADGIIPDDIDNGTFDKVIDKYLSDHRMNESYGRRRSSGRHHGSRRTIKVDGVLYEAVGRRARTRR